MQRQHVFAAGAVVLAILAVVGTQISTSSPAYCQDQPKRQLPQTSQSKMSFRDDVMPIFVGRCVACHQPSAEGTAKSGLDLTSYAGVMKGTKFGPMVIPGDPNSSNLMRLLDWRVSPEIRMPHGKKQLSTCDRDAIRAWILEGAKDN
jgi:mono/diheme cytochrome c family protein